VTKLVAAGVVLVAVALYLAHSRGASAAKVGSCLAKRGATVNRSRFLEDAFGISADGEQLPDGLKRQLEDAEKHLFDVSLGPDSGLLMDTKRAHQDAHLVAMAAAYGLDITPQSRGKVVMLWYGGPTSESRAAVDHCLG
jgi:hypothetical protein